MSSQARFVVNPALTAIAMTYKNGVLIADDVLPRLPVASEVFKYNKYTQADGFTVPDTKVQRKGRVNQIDWSATQITDQTNDYGLEDAIPQKDIDLARAVPGGGIDPLPHSTELISDLVALDREVRAAALVFNAGNYPAANKSTLAGNSQWSFKGDDSNVASDPITDILTAMDSMLMRPNIGVAGRAVASALQTNPRIVKAFNATSGDTGIVPLDFIATLFGLDKILVGEGWLNTAKKGQAPAMSRVWGKYFALIHQNRLVASPQQEGVTFGFTAQFGTRVAMTFEDVDVGLRGGTRVRVGEAVKELVSASDCGYLFSAAVA